MIPEGFDGGTALATTDWGGGQVFFGTGYAMHSAKQGQDSSGRETKSRAASCAELAALSSSFITYDIIIRRTRRQVARFTTSCYIITTRGGRACYHHHHSWVLLLAFIQASGQASYIRRNGMRRQRPRIEGVWFDSSDMAARRETDGQADRLRITRTGFLLGQPASSSSEGWLACRIAISASHFVTIVSVFCCSACFQRGRVVVTLARDRRLVAGPG